jgi:hypothetical protein
MSDLVPNPPRLAPVPDGTENCGCCVGIELATAREIDNRPGLSSIEYRIGVHADFRASLHSGLDVLRTRDDDDFTIGLIDAFACAADVLTFYQERIANESYLGTASETVSLGEMGRLIGYRLRPGVAAETALAFTFETPPSPAAGVKPEPGMFVTGVPAQVSVPAGLAVRSVPAPGEQPQVFETVESFTGRPAWNALQPWMSERVVPARGSRSTWLRGVNTRLRAGDALLFVGDEFTQRTDANQWDFRILDEVVADAAQDRTRVSWQTPLGSINPPGLPARVPRVFALRRRASVYGHNAPAWGAMTAEFRTDYSKAFPVTLEAARASTSLADIAAAAPEAGESNAEAPTAAARIAVLPTQWPRFTLSDASSSVDLDAIYPEMQTGGFVVLTKGNFGRAAMRAAVSDHYVELYRVTGVEEVSREEFGIATKLTRLRLDGANYDLFKAAVRTTSVFGQSEPLEFADSPVTEEVDGANVPVDASADGLTEGRRLLVRGLRARDGGAVVHSAVLKSAASVPDRPNLAWLEIDPPLPAKLRRASVVVHANVALATHGETVTQILGAGNAATPFQRFELKQLPLTHRAAGTELGAASELVVRVDDIAWQQRDSLYGAARNDRAFTLVVDDQGRNVVQFGDGVRGARLPSGANNIRAKYRKGLGVAGNIGAESLTQLTQRPLGVKGVSNPLPASGGTNPEGAGQARQTMPLMTRTLGRAVSLLDYEDFARAFAGIAKARAQVLQLSAGPVVAITIAGSDGVVISPDNPIWKNLSRALADNGDPHVAVRLLAHQPTTFRLGLTIRRDPAYELAMVLAAVEAALRSRFGFANRALGQPVQQSDVIAVAQGVPGVVAVDLDYLYGGTTPASQTSKSRQVRLLADRMRVSGNTLRADELLLLSPDAFDRLEEMP